MEKDELEKNLKFYMKASSEKIDSTEVLVAFMVS